MSEEQHTPQSVLGPEKIEWRGLDSKVYEKLGQPGEYQLIGFEQPVHWLDTKGKLQDIDLNIVDNKVDKCCYIAEIMTDNFGLKIQYRDTGQKFEIILKDIDGIKIRGRTPDVITNGNVAEWKEVVRDLDIIFEFQQDQVRIFRKLKTKDASTKIHFETITEQLVAEEQVQVNQKFFGQDAKGREVILETTFSEPETITHDGVKIVKQQIYDTFTKQIINIDEKTRVRTPGDDVEYPVTIDPTITIKPTASPDQFDWIIKWSSSAPTYTYANANSGPMRNFAYGLVTGSAYSSGTNGRLQGTLTRFKGITIPIGATINSAIISQWYWRQPSINVANVRMRAVNSQNATPTTVSAIAPSDAYALMTRTNWVKDTGSVTITESTGFSSLTNSSVAQGSNLKTWDVKTMVQRLVDQFAYVNQSMFFDQRPFPTDQGQNIYFYANQDYPQGSPGTSYGAGPQVTKLVIDFSVPVTEKTFIADAMLLYQGAVWGQCGDQPW